MRLGFGYVTIAITRDPRRVGNSPPCNKFEYNKKFAVRLKKS